LQEKVLKPFEVHLCILNHKIDNTSFQATRGVRGKGKRAREGERSSEEENEAERARKRRG
jgi:hypothetical protein